MSAVPAQPAVETVAIPRALARRLALPVVFAVATVYHFLQSRGHATPTVFNDELLYAKLSKSVAAGDGPPPPGGDLFFPAHPPPPTTPPTPSCRSRSRRRTASPSAASTSSSPHRSRRSCRRRPARCRP